MEIVDKGYNPEKFYEFWQTFDIGINIFDLDLNNATMEDVYSVVAEFQKLSNE